jgi:sugar/nucleoside kinase (ribokinase family)
MADNKPLDIIGIGSPIMDTVVQVDDAFIDQIDGEKGGMNLVSHEEQVALLEKLPANRTSSGGGAAGNTIMNMAALGSATGFVGKLGQDADGELYKKDAEKVGCTTELFKTTADASTAQCISLVTPDCQRTMRTHLGAAATLSPEDISIDDFNKAGYAYIEGYLLFNRDLLQKVLETVKAAGATACLDLGAFEVVSAAKDILPELLDKYIDIVFANEEEAEAFTGEKDPKKALSELSKYCDCTIVKVGAEGAYLSENGKTCHVEPAAVKQVVDTTGAGDSWASGFLHARLQGLPLKLSGKLGAFTAAQIIQQMGARLNDEQVAEAKQQLKTLKEQSA